MEAAVGEKNTHPRELENRGRDYLQNTPVLFSLEGQFTS